VRNVRLRLKSADPNIIIMINGKTRYSADWRPANYKKGSP
jgi:hypothetical protein